MDDLIPASLGWGLGAFLTVGALLLLQNNASGGGRVSGLVLAAIGLGFLATRILPMLGFAPPSNPMVQPYRIQQALSTDPLFGPLALTWETHNREGYMRMVYRLRSTMQWGGDEEDFGRVMREELIREMKPKIKGVDDETLRELAAVARDQFNYLGHYAPHLCQKIWRNEPATGAGESVSRQLIAREIAVYLKVFAVPPETRRPVAGHKELNEAMSALALQAAERKGVDPRILDPSVNVTGYERLHCETAALVMDGLAAMHPSRAGPLMRALWLDSV
jgi:hypothetical protein